MIDPERDIRHGFHEGPYFINSAKTVKICYMHLNRYLGSGGDVIFKSVPPEE